MPRRSSCTSRLRTSRPSMVIVPLGRLDEPVDHPQRRRLPAARTCRAGRAPRRSAPRATARRRRPFRRGTAWSPDPAGSSKQPAARWRTPSSGGDDEAADRAGPQPAGDAGTDAVADELQRLHPTRPAGQPAHRPRGWPAARRTDRRRATAREAQHVRGHQRRRQSSAVDARPISTASGAEAGGRRRTQAAPSSAVRGRTRDPRGGPSSRRRARRRPPMRRRAARRPRPTRNSRHRS